MCYTQRKIEGGVGALRESDDTNFLKPNGQSRNLNIYDYATYYVALADSPFDLYYWVIFRHDFSLGSNFHKVPFELIIHGTDFHQ